MLTFRGANIGFGIILFLIAGLYFLYSFSGWLFLIPVVVYLLILFYGSYYIRSQFFMSVICSLPSNEKHIALSFDDGPLLQYTANILNILDKHQAPAIFFCIGNRAEANEDLVKEILRRGHIIGNHSYSHHRYFDLWSSAKMLVDLKKMDEVAEKVTGLRPKFFRPPYGVMNPNLKKAIIKGNYTPIGWNMRSFDTIAKNPEKLLAKLKKSIRPGKIYLFHDSIEVTANILDQFLQEVKSQGYTVVALDKVLNLQPYA